jgi:hypothetical protein
MSITQEILNSMETYSDIIRYLGMYDNGMTRRAIKKYITDMSNTSLLYTQRL